MSEASIFKARDGFRSIAQRAAVCFDVTQYMREVNPLYQISYNRYLDLYDAAISHSERYDSLNHYCFFFHIVFYVYDMNRLIFQRTKEFLVRRNYRYFLYKFAAQSYFRLCLYYLYV